MYCRKCGTKLEDGVLRCPNCGEKQVDNTPATIFCKHCGERIDADCIICPKCGKQVASLKAPTPNIVINNTNQNANSNTNINAVPGFARVCNKWISFLLCLFLGYLGAHKFYEGKIGMGILYLFTLGIFGFGWVIDAIGILLKPNPYYVYR